MHGPVKDAVAGLDKNAGRGERTREVKGTITHSSLIQIHQLPL